jgi:Competence-damaged protein
LQLRTCIAQQQQQQSNNNYIEFITSHQSTNMAAPRPLSHPILKIPSSVDGLSEGETDVQSKMKWTAETAVAYCQAMKTDYAIAEGGATGPTFRPEDMNVGFYVIAVAGRDSDGTIAVLMQQVLRSDHASRQLNMRSFAYAAANLASSVVANIELDDTITTNGYEPPRALLFDRATHLRSDNDALALLQTNAKYVVICKSQILVKDGLELALLNQQQWIDAFGTSEQNQITFLGMHNVGDDPVPVFGIDIRDTTSGTGDVPDVTFSFVDTRTTAPLFDPLHNELALHATAYAEWQRRTPYCSLWGGTTEFVDGGTRCRCTVCNTSSWPRQDPSMIAVISSRCQQKV